MSKKWKLIYYIMTGNGISLCTVKEFITELHKQRRHEIDKDNRCLEYRFLYSLAIGKTTTCFYTTKLANTVPQFSVPSEPNTHSRTSHERAVSKLLPQLLFGLCIKGMCNAPYSTGHVFSSSHDQYPMI